MAKSDNIEDEKYIGSTEHNQHSQSAVDEARAGTEAEHSLTFREGIKLYPKAMAWSALISTAIIMEGYDTWLLGNFFAYPAFLDKFGEVNAQGVKAISASWMTALGNGTAGGQCVGLILNGLAIERFGYKRTMIVAMSFMICVLFMPFFAPNIRVLLAAQILQGIPWGAFQTLTTSYASEICPVALRAYLTTYVNLCWVIGQLIAGGMLRGLLNRTDEWGYKIPYAIQWVWPVPILIGSFFAPESPWWLVRHGRIADARKVIVSITSPRHTTFNPDAYVAMIVHTNALEQSVSAGTSYFDCFKGVDLRRTEITCVVWVIQAWCGSSLMGQSTYFLIQAGMATENAFSLNIAQSALGFCGTVASWGLMGRIGRRKLYLYGQVVMCLLLIIIGGIGCLPASQKTNASWGIGALLLIFTFVYDITVGPVCYCLVAEMSSTRLRSKTVVLSRFSYNIAGIATGFFQPYMLNPENLNWGAKTAFFWLGVGAILTVWSFYRLPEPKDRTYGELDVLFEQRVSARRFATTDVDQFADSQHSAVANAQVEAKAEGEVNHVERL